MAIIKEKKFKISSVIENLSPEGLVEGDAEKTEIAPTGFLKIDGDNFNITYSEMSEGGKIVSDILITPSSVRVKRVGAVESEMYFEEGVKHQSLYTVGGYAFDTEVLTRKIRSSISKDGGDVSIFYDMKIGGADKKVRMKIQCL